VLGQDEQEFVVNPDGFVNADPDPLADLEIFGGVPAADSLGLEIGVKPLDEGSVFGTIRDEDRVELDRLQGVDEGRDVGNPSVGKPTSSQERLGDLPSGTDDGVGAQAAGAY
jgi:hypothetical protein